MSRAVLENVLEQIKSLGPEELREVSRAVAERLSPEEELRRRETLLESMREAGLISSVVPQRSPDDPVPPLVAVEGEPLSEAIIRDRR